MEKKTEEKSARQKRYEFDIADMVKMGGFTEQQAAYLLNWLNEYIPLY